MVESKIINKLKITPKTKVLDVGGAMKQRSEIKVDTLVDLLRPEESPYTKSTLKAKNFVRLDVTTQTLPFKDKEFDVVLCTHTLEDLPTPFLVLEQMQRVAKRGYIETPLMGTDIVFSHVDTTNWLTGFRRTPGIAHHKWLFWKHLGKLWVIPKNYPLLYSPEFHVTSWRGETNLSYFWEGKINYHKVDDLDFHMLVSLYREFVKQNEASLTFGKPLIYLDNPYYFAKELVKLFLKKGTAFEKH